MVEDGFGDFINYRDDGLAEKIIFESESDDSKTTIYRSKVAERVAGLLLTSSDEGSEAVAVLGRDESLMMTLRPYKGYLRSLYRFTHR